ncbi:MAG TPA: YihY/virulence factor BrkB family protein [Terriglobales bacterium]|jgi:membrane protein|nr:YihY/virulence factor BrkB family protein [Terriglobales bacterium]
MARFFRTLKLALWRAFEHDALGYAKGSAFSSILTFFPAMLLATSLMLMFDSTRAFANELARDVTRYLPPGIGIAIRNYFDITQAQPVRVLILASVVTLWTSSGVMTTWMLYFRLAYKLANKWGLVKERLIAFGLVIMAGVPLSFATVMVAFGNEIEQRFADRMAYELGHMVEPYIILLWTILRWMIASLTGVAVMALIYHHAVPRTQRWHSVLPGAALATGLWFPATAGFGYYVKHFAQYSLFYGSLAAAIVLLVWLYIISVIILVGAEFNAVLYPRAMATGETTIIAVTPRKRKVR